MAGRRLAGVIVWGALMLVVTGCDVLGLGEEGRLGILVHYGDTAGISVPDAVDAGESFTVAFNTFGGGCVTRGPTRVTTTGRTATVTPIDFHSGGDICTLELRYFDHTTSVRLNTTGNGTVVVRGRVEPGGEVTERAFPILVQ